VCGFSFEESYGELGKGYIEVHHLNPLSDRDTERTTTVEEVAVVCANCHRVLHRNGKAPIPLEEIRKIVEQRRQKQSAG
jgi:5-methylcytosine-specific restriction protein A